MYMVCVYIYIYICTVYGIVIDMKYTISKIYGHIENMETWMGINGGFMGLNGSYPLVNKHSELDNLHLE